ncbi:MAG: hypothetical protein Q8R82_22410 [Hyphomonadaceae bacterium]|nr:hypothetical protein [Hyphomonadaceae bacterium]
MVEPFGDRRVSSIPRADIVRAVDPMQAKGFAIDVDRTLANFKTLFRWRVERGLIER